MQASTINFGQLSQKMKMAKYVLSNNDFQELTHGVGMAFKYDEPDKLILRANRLQSRLGEIKKSNKTSPNLLKTTIEAYYEDMSNNISDYVLKRTGKKLDFWLKVFSENVKPNKFAAFYAEKGIKDKLKTNNPDQVEALRTAFTSMYMVPEAMFSDGLGKFPTYYLNEYEQEKNIVEDEKVEATLKQIHHPKLVDIAVASADKALAY